MNIVSLFAMNTAAVNLMNILKSLFFFAINAAANLMNIVTVFLL